MDIGRIDFEQQMTLVDNMHAACSMTEASIWKAFVTLL